MDSFDLVIVGAGLFGLNQAKTYLSIHPEANVAIYEGSDGIGGVWVRHRLYPTLKTNNFVGTYELSDYPMDESFGVQPGCHVSGESANLYLERYADTYDLRRLVRLCTTVETAEFRGHDGWLLRLRTRDDSTQQVHAKKLIIATGLTSEPQMPLVPGAQAFGGLFIHAKDMLKRHEELRQCTKIVVVGGSKSSWDAAYLYASQGIKVEMLIRRDGRGPAWMAPPRVTPWKYPLEKLVHTRLLTLFSPCSWGEADGYKGARWFLHSTMLGRCIVALFWWILCTEVILINGYNSHPEMKKLKPWANSFWTGGSGRGLLNYSSDFFELVRKGQISVRYGEVQRAGFMTLRLTDGSEIPTDAVIFCTGWKSTPPMKFLPEGIESDLGLPGSHQRSPLEDRLCRQADAQILCKFPCLRNAPGAMSAKQRDPSTDKQGRPPPRPFWLYRSMLPPAMAKYRNFAFAGMLTSISTPLIAQTQSLWLTAFFDGSMSLSHCLSRQYDRCRLELKSEEEMVRWEAIYHSQFCKWRYPRSSGPTHTDFVFDALPYLDLLLGDLGLRTHRKSSGLSELFQAYTPRDYQGLIEEWICKTRPRDTVKKPSIMPSR